MRGQGERNVPGVSRDAEPRDRRSPQVGVPLRTRPPRRRRVDARGERGWRAAQLHGGRVVRHRRRAAAQRRAAARDPARRPRRIVPHARPGERGHARAAGHRSGRVRPLARRAQVPVPHPSVDAARGRGAGALAARRARAGPGAKVKRSGGVPPRAGCPPHRMPYARGMASNAPDLTEPRVHGEAIVYRLFDVGYAIALDRALDLLASSGPERRRPTRGEAQTIQIPNPPVTVGLGAESIEVDGRPVQAELSARVFDFGVVSLRAKVIAHAGLPWNTFASWGASVNAAAWNEVLGRARDRLLLRIAPAIEQPMLSPVTVGLGAESIEVAGRPVQAELSARVFDFGVVSLRAKVIAHAGLPWNTFASWGASVK